jgi:two-component system copper resistance phosphate regulon response regulator CusR
MSLKMASEGCTSPRNCNFDLIILDVMLPGLDGWQVLTRLRQQEGNRSLVLFLTARDAVHERVRGFELGRGRLFGETLRLFRIAGARQVAAAPRSAAPTGNALRLGDLEIDVLRQRASRAGHRLELTSKEFLLLSLLARPRGRSAVANLDRGSGLGHELRQRHQRGGRQRAPVAQQGGRSLRRKLIHTVRGAGYVLESEPLALRLPQSRVENSGIPVSRRLLAGRLFLVVLATASLYLVLRTSWTAAPSCSSPTRCMCCAPCCAKAGRRGRAARGD